MKIIGQGAKGHGFPFARHDLASLAMASKIFHTSCKTILSPPCVQ